MLHCSHDGLMMKFLVGKCNGEKSEEIEEHESRWHDRWLPFHHGNAGTGRGGGVAGNWQAQIVGIERKRAE